MAAVSYIAGFGSNTGNFFCAALSWEASEPLLPNPWRRLLASNSEIDMALRLSAGEKPRVILLLTADDRKALDSVIGKLREGGLPAGLREAQNAEEFDVLTDGSLSREHLRVRHDGYHFGDQPLACDFRLYSSWVGQELPEGVSYQVALRPYRPGSEQQRRARKYLAWLDLERPFTEPICAMQKILAQRLLAAGWLADEYLIFPSPESRTMWEERIRKQFSETTGRIGFHEAPLEAGDFSDWVTIGCHTARESGIPASLPVQGARAFSGEEFTWLAGQSLKIDEVGRTGVKPEVFISYASGDFSHADAVRRHLENVGVSCWIAPRDINNTGLPYTEAISGAIDKARAVVILLSPSANLSVHIPRELDLALSRRLPIIPLRLADVEPAGQLAYLLRTCQRLDVFNRTFEDALSELIVRLQHLRI